MIGKITPYIGLGFAQVSVILLMAQAALPRADGRLLSRPACAAAAALHRHQCHRSAITFSTLARNQMQAMQMTFFYLPAVDPAVGLHVPVPRHAGLGAIDRRGAAAHAFSAGGARHHAEGQRPRPGAAASVARGALPAGHRHARPPAFPPYAGLIGLVLLCDTGAETAAGGDAPGVACGGFGLLGVNLDRGRSGNALPSRRRRHRRRARFPCRAQDPLPPDAPLNVGPMIWSWSLGSVQRSCRPTSARMTICCNLGRRPDSLSASVRYRRFRRRRETRALHWPFVPLRAVARRGRLLRPRGPGRRERRLRIRCHDRLPLRFVRGFLTLRQDTGGHHGVVGEVGVDVIAEPLPKLTVSLGPRLGLASSDYLDTYLGVDAEQSAASGLREFDPDGGVSGVGLEVEARYALTPAWSVVAHCRLRTPRRRRGRLPRHRCRQREPVHRGDRRHLPLRARSLQVAPLGTGRSPMICRTPLSGPSKLPAKARAASPAPSRAFVNLTYPPLPLCLAA